MYKENGFEQRDCPNSWDLVTANVWENLRQVYVKWDIRYTPSCHSWPTYQECLARSGLLNLQDYRDGLVALIESLDQPPLILGHSLGA